MYCFMKVSMVGLPKVLLKTICKSENYNLTHFAIVVQQPTGYHLSREEIPKKDTAAITNQRIRKEKFPQERPEYTSSPSFLNPYNHHNAHYIRLHEEWLNREFKKLLK